MGRPGDDQEVVVTVGFLRDVAERLIADRKLRRALGRLGPDLREVAEGAREHIEDHRLLRRIQELTRKTDPEATPVDRFPVPAPERIPER